MTAQDLHDCNTVLARLSSRVNHYRFTDNRAGSVPPADWPTIRSEIADALDTLNELAAPQPPKLVAQLAQVEARC